MYAEQYLDPRAARRASLLAIVERCYASAHGAFAAGDDVNAKRLFWMLAILAPRDERAWIGLGACGERRAQWPLAAAMYGMGAACPGGSGWSHFGRGRALKHLGKDLDADRAFDWAESIATDSALLAAIAEERRNP
jgi:hypothetical protein